jgi:adenine deaminase
LASIGSGLKSVLLGVSRVTRFALSAIALLSFCTNPVGAQSAYELVFANGRVMDPETELDAIRHLGISGGRIAAISAEPLTGRLLIDVSGLVVAPGFIDLNAHGQDPLA